MHHQNIDCTRRETSYVASLGELLGYELNYFPCSDPYGEHGIERVNLYQLV